MYMSMALGRWWRMRTAGVGTVWCSALKLTMCLSHYSGDDDELEAIHRYARASLAIVVLKRRGTDDTLSFLEARGMLTSDERECFSAVSENHAECMWVWIFDIVDSFWKEGKISDHCWLYCANTVEDGRGAIETINGQHRTPIPFEYVHMLAMMVKLHNLVLAITSGFVVA